MLKLSKRLLIFIANKNVKVESFIVEDINNTIENSKSNITDYVYDVLFDYAYNYDDTLDRKIINLNFTKEQKDIISAKMLEIGHDINLSKFIRHALFANYMKKHNIDIVTKEFDCKLINIDKVNLLMRKCRKKLLNGKYTSYDSNVLRNNEKFKDVISTYTFNNDIKNNGFNIDFLEYDMLMFVYEKLSEGKQYSDLVGLSTKQFASDHFIETIDGENLKPFIDYENVVPNTDTFYYLYIYYAFSYIEKDLDLLEIFDETKNHINWLLRKYTFNNIFKHYEQVYNITELEKIFDEECVEYIKENEIMKNTETIVDKADYSIIAFANNHIKKTIDVGDKCRFIYDKYIEFYNENYDEEQIISQIIFNKTLKSLFNVERKKTKGDTHWKNLVYWP